MSAQLDAAVTDARRIPSSTAGREIRSVAPRRVQLLSASNLPPFAVTNALVIHRSRPEPRNRRSENEISKTEARVAAVLGVREFHHSHRQTMWGQVVDRLKRQTPSEGSPGGLRETGEKPGIGRGRIGLTLVKWSHGARRYWRSANLSPADIEGAAAGTDPIAMTRRRVNVNLQLRLNGRAAINSAAARTDPVAHPLRRRRGDERTMRFRPVHRSLCGCCDKDDHGESNPKRY